MSGAWGPKFRGKGVAEGLRGQGLGFLDGQEEVWEQL
jgi:hypothetical protein